MHSFLVKELSILIIQPIVGKYYWQRHCPSKVQYKPRPFWKILSLVPVGQVIVAMVFDKFLLAPECTSY